MSGQGAPCDHFLKAMPLSILDRGPKESDGVIIACLEEKRLPKPFIFAKARPQISRNQTPAETYFCDRDVIKIISPEAITNCFCQLYSLISSFQVDYCR